MCGVDASGGRCAPPPLRAEAQDFASSPGGYLKNKTRRHPRFLVPATGAHPPTSRPINELLRRWLPSSCRVARRWAIAELPHRARGAAVDRESPVPLQEPPPCGRGSADERRARPDSTRTPPCPMAPNPDSRCDAGRGTRAASTCARARYKYPLSALWIFETRPPGPPTHWGMPSDLLSVGASWVHCGFLELWTNCLARLIK